MAKMRNLLNNFMGYTKYLHGTRFKKKIVVSNDRYL